MAPEALTDKTASGEYLDVFSLGAIAYHLFSGKPPAATFFELSQKLKEGNGLQISSVLDGAGKELQFLIQYSTYPEVTSRLDSSSEFLAYLEKVEEELTKPDDEGTKPPLEAKAKDRIEGGFLVKSRLGKGACSLALLVERGGAEYVLKVALDSEHNTRLRDEAGVLTKLHHQNIVDLVQTFQIDGLFCLLTQKAGDTTLAERLRQEGSSTWTCSSVRRGPARAVNYLEQEGIPHRDIKPDNIGVRPLGRGDKLHLALFDFSLSRTPAEQIRAGTPPYLDPFLGQRTPPRWDLHAERFAVAMTLYEMATGALPVWGDGKSDPGHCSTARATIESELFEPNLREAMTAFFRKALSRDIGNRFDNCDEMLRAWRKIFESIDQPSRGTDHGQEYDLDSLLANATPDTQIAELGLSTRAMNVLDRLLNIIALRDLLRVPLNRIYKARGVGNKTRREIGGLVRKIRQRFPELQEQAVEGAEPQAEAGEPVEEAEAPAQSIDQIVRNALGSQPRGKVQTAWHAVNAFLGLDDLATQAPMGWPSQVEVAEHLAVTRARVAQILVTLRHRWRKSRR